MRDNLCAITDIVSLRDTAIDVRSCIFPRNTPFQTSVASLTTHDTLLTARRRRVFFVSALFFWGGEEPIGIF